MVGLVQPRLFARGLGILVLRGAGAAGALGLAVVIARRLGPEEAGGFYVGTSIAMVASSLGQLGLGGALLRFVATHRARNDLAGVNGSRRRSRRLVISASLAASAVALLLVPLTTRWFGGTLDGATAVWAAVAVVPVSLVFVESQAFIGLERQVHGALLLNVAPPAVSLVLVIVTGADTAAAALAVWVGAHCASALVASVLWRRMRLPSGAAAGPDRSTLLRSALPLLVVSAGLLVMTWTDTIVLGVLGTADDVGIYNSARQVSLLLSLILLAGASVVAPRFATFWELGDREGLARLARQSAGVGAAAALIPAAVMVAAPGRVLGAFGAGFDAGDTALRLLAAGQFVNVAAGAVGYVLIMTGNERRHSAAQVLAAAVNIPLDVVLVPRWGMAGAAAATAASLVIFNGVAVWAARNALGAWPVFVPTRRRRRDLGPLTAQRPRPTSS
ncbi:MAG: oligosaccharide flippase family protein [Acidimicrobiales bacterium]|nr:oligosaccharide flippase family protein [Acidimicrobiales bacterium]